MSSSQKTSYLGLNAWLGTDRPQRIDFVEDNTLIDTAIKNHAQNTTVHCTSTEKSKIENPFMVVSYVGTGEESQTINFGFSPKMAMVFYKQLPPFQTDASGNTIINSSITVKSNGGIGGILISGNDVIVSQSTTATNGMLFNLNKHNGQYCVIAFK